MLPSALKSFLTTTQVLGQSGKIQIAPDENVASSEDRITITMDALRQVDASNNVLGSGGSQKQSTQSFANQVASSLLHHAASGSATAPPATRVPPTFSNHTLMNPSPWIAHRISTSAQDFVFSALEATTYSGLRAQKIVFECLVGGTSKLAVTTLIFKVNDTRSFNLRTV